MTRSGVLGFYEFLIPRTDVPWVVFKSLQVYQKFSTSTGGVFQFVS